MPAAAGAGGRAGRCGGAAARRRGRAGCELGRGEKVQCSAPARSPGCPGDPVQVAARGGSIQRFHPLPVAIRFHPYLSWQHLNQPQGWIGVILLSLSLSLSSQRSCLQKLRTCSRTTSYQRNGIVTSGKSSLAYPRGLCLQY